MVIGGGAVARQKLEGLLRFTREVTVIAPEISAEVREMGPRLVEKAYAPGMLEDFALVYACTNDRSVNRRVRDDARALGIPVCVADDPELCDFISPAVFTKGPMTVAVSSGGADVRRAIAWRDRIRELAENDPDW